MIELKLPFGEGSLRARADANLLEPALVEPVGRESVVRALEESGLADIARGRKNAAVAVPDHTRPFDSELVLPPLLSLLYGAGLAREDVTVVMATGLHRPPDEEETSRLISCASGARIIAHDARDTGALVELGETRGGTRLSVNRAYAEADLKVVCGLVEPHFFAGFSGGPKLVAPGLAGEETILRTHGPACLTVEADLGRTAGNPVYEEIAACAEIAGVDFCVDVVNSPGGRPAGVFCGPLLDAHSCAVELSSRVSRVTARPAPTVVASGGGLPLDATLYQAVKGEYSGSRLLEPGGTLLLISECREGAGTAEFARQLRELARGEWLFEEGRLDGWEVEMHRRAREKASRVILVSRGVGREEAESFGLEWAPGLEKALRDLPRANVLPGAPFVLPCVEGA